MYRWILLIIPILFITSCNMSWKRPLKEKQANKSAYEQCLQDYPDNQIKCDAYKDSYDDSVRQMKGKSEDPTSDGRLYNE
ncbi:MAG: hypothetical protein WD000_01225 [Thermodesulfobacteriota bacterium]